MEGSSPAGRIQRDARPGSTPPATAGYTGSDPPPRRPIRSEPVETGSDDAHRESAGAQGRRQARALATAPRAAAPDRAPPARRAPDRRLPLARLPPGRLPAQGHRLLV